MCVCVFFHPIAKESEGVCGVQGKILNAHYSDPHTVRNGGKRKGETAAATAAPCKHTIDHNMHEAIGLPFRCTLVYAMVIDHGSQFCELLCAHL